MVKFADDERAEESPKELEAHVRAPDTPDENKDSNFIAAKVYEGCKDGFVYKMDNRGLGYYRLVELKLPMRKNTHKLCVVFSTKKKSYCPMLPGPEKPLPCLVTCKTLLSSNNQSHLDSRSEIPLGP